MREKALRVIAQAREADIDLLDLLLSGFGAGNDEIGDRFDKGVLSLPELIYAAEVMKSATGAILEYLNRDGEESSVREKKRNGNFSCGGRRRSRYRQKYCGFYPQNGRI